MSDDKTPWTPSQLIDDGVPTWYREDILCTGVTYQDKVTVTLAQGAPLDDPQRLFDSGPDGNVRRPIDWLEDARLDEQAFGDLVRAAALNES